jgi:hypothetical protein
MRRINRKRPIDYILPFLVILGLGVIGILGYQLWQSFEKQGKADVYFYLAEGKAKVLPYGQTAWDNAFSGTKLLIGDSVKTTALGKALLQFFNGTIIRLGPDTAVTLTDLTKDTETEKIVVTMDNGVIWVNGRKSPGVKAAEYDVRTANMLVKAKGTVFEVENDSAQSVRVLEGEVSVDVMVNVGDKERVADTISIGVGQEIVLDEATLRAYSENQTPSVLMAISDQFKAGDWYLWNIGQDKNPTSYATQSTGTEAAGGTTESSSTVQGTEVTTQSNQSTSQSEEGVTEQTQATTETTAQTEEVQGLAAPEILKPGVDARTVTGGIVTISGTASAGTSKIVVEQVIDGKTDSYVLSKFKAGDTAWSYNVAEKYGNLKAGENTYSFYAYYKAGEKSSAADITLTFDKEKVEITDKLEAPVVLKYNGTTSPVVTTGTVLVEGSIKGAQSVVVNGYTLSKFVAGGDIWTYSAKEALGNLKPGLNEYEVYGIDPAGNKSAVAKFTITYNKEETAVSTQTTQETQTTQTTQQTGPGYSF